MPSTAKIAQHLDELLGRCLVPLGFAVREAAGTSRRYEGTVAGRRVSVSPVVRSRTKYTSADVSRRRYDGFSLELVVETSTQTRLALSHPPRGSDDNIVVSLVTTALMRWNGMRRVPSPHSDLDELRVWAFDPAWTHSCLSHEDVLHALRDVQVYADASERDEGRRYSTWSFSPGAMRLLVSPSIEAVTPAAVEQWLEGAARLAQLSEAHATHRTATKTRIEKQVEENPRAVIPYALALLFGLPLALMVGLTVLFGVGWLLIGDAVLWFPAIFMFFFMPYAMFLVMRQWLRHAQAQRRSSE